MSIVGKGLHRRLLLTILCVLDVGQVAESRLAHRTERLAD